MPSRLDVAPLLRRGAFENPIPMESPRPPHTSVSRVYWLLEFGGSYGPSYACGSWRVSEGRRYRFRNFLTADFFSRPLDLNSLRFQGLGSGNPLER